MTKKTPSALIAQPAAHGPPLGPGGPARAGRHAQRRRARDVLPVDRFLEVVPVDRFRDELPFVALSIRFEIDSTFFAASFSWRRFSCRSFTESRSPSARAFSMRPV